MFLDFNSINIIGGERNMKNIITISGNLGSGKSTVGELLAKRFGLTTYASGDLMRMIAQKHHMTINEFNDYLKHHKEVDYLIDQEAMHLAKQEDCLLFVSRMAWYFIPDSFKVYLYVEEQEGARRILQDQKRSSEHYENYQKALEGVCTRFEKSRMRFLDTYQVDITDPKHYDLYLDTTCLSISEVEEIISQQYLDFVNRKEKVYAKEFDYNRNKN